MSNKENIDLKEQFVNLTNDLLKTLDIFPREHKKLMESLRKNDGLLLGLSELINYSIRLKKNYNLFSQGEY